MNDLISVIVPIYNVEAYLSRCIDSLLAQTYQNYEIIMVDDCSTDNSREIAQRYMSQYPGKCVLIPREANGGSAAARNTGIVHSKGNWITFVDSDDWVRTDCLEILLQTAVQENADIVTGNLCYVYSDGHIDRMSFAPLCTKSSQKLKVALIRSYPCTRLFRSCFLKESGLQFPTNVRRAEDMGLIIPLFTKTEKLSFVDETIYYYWQRSTSISNTNQKDVDVSFYDRAFQNILDHAEKGFETELEYRAICELMYGKIMIMIRSGRKKHEIIEEVDKFHRQYPQWKENPYLKYLAKGKRVFVAAASRKSYFMLKLLIWAWDQRMKNKMA